MARGRGPGADEPGTLSATSRTAAKKTTGAKPDDQYVVILHIDASNRGENIEVIAYEGSADVMSRFLGSVGARSVGDGRSRQLRRALDEALTRARPFIAKKLGLPAAQPSDPD